MLPRSQQKLLHFILFSIALLCAWLWWVPVRCLLDGNGFQWGNRFGYGGLSGNGMLGDFPVLALLSAYLVSLIYMGWRGAKMPFHVLLIVWCAVHLGTSLISSIQHPEAYRFRGDTFGIDISLAFAGPALWGLLTVAVLYWTGCNLSGRSSATEKAAWTRGNTTLLLVALLLLPLQFVLFRLGEQHGTSDKLALMLTIFQWVLVNLSFMPREPLPAGQPAEDLASYP